MKELKCILSAILYVLAQFVVVVLKPVVKFLDHVAQKCAFIAGTELAKLHKPAENPEA